MFRNRWKVTTLCALLAAAANSPAFAHTRLQTPEVNENTRNYNAVVVGHGCSQDDRSYNVLGTSVVFPDGVDSTITDTTDAANPKVLAQPLTSYVQNYGNVLSVVKDRSVFDRQYAKKTPNSSNVIGFWAAGGDGLPPSGFAGLLPMRINAIIFVPTSCVRSATFVLAIADVCESTSTAGFSDATVNLWTPAVGSQFDGAKDGDGYNSPATLKVKRTSALPAECGAGIDIKVTPSAAQINRDLPAVTDDGVQVWPAP